MTGAATRLHPDPRACAIARAVADDVYPDTVILFGSRARGDFTTESDVDLLIIMGADHLTHEEFVRASKVAHDKSGEVYGHPMGVDVVHLNVNDFNEGRRARNHVAGQAVRDGVDPGGEKVVYDNPEPTNWPDMQQRVINARREVRVLNVLVEGEADQEAIGFHAQQALENALKGWISALDTDYRNTHNLGDLAAIVRTRPEEIATPAGERLSWLTAYAVRYRYVGVQVDLQDRFGLLSSVTETVEAIIARIDTLTGSVEQ
jgi:HEPN domain-containing protein